MLFSVASWNVNSIRARLARLLAWLDARQPDVVCLQETKVADEDFPFEELRQAGYVATTFGQRTYNGVAILMRAAPLEIVRGFDDGVPDTQSRFVVAGFGTAVGPLRVASVYAPNGSAVGTDKFAYKLEWYARLSRWLGTHGASGPPLLLCGDFNVAPEDRDVHDPLAWSGQVLCSADERAALGRVRACGYEDLFRRLNPELVAFSWWDYRQLSFPRNQGLRIDHIFCPPVFAARCRSVVIERDMRKGKQPSDHAPVVAELDLAAAA